MSVLNFSHTYANHPGVINRSVTWIMQMTKKEQRGREERVWTSANLCWHSPQGQFCVEGVASLLWSSPACSDPTQAVLVKKVVLFVFMLEDAQLISAKVMMSQWGKARLHVSMEFLYEYFSQCYDVQQMSTLETSLNTHLNWSEQFIVIAAA